MKILNLVSGKLVLLFFIIFCLNSNSFSQEELTKTVSGYRHSNWTNWIIHIEQPSLLGAKITDVDVIITENDATKQRVGSDNNVEYIGSCTANYNYRLEYRYENQLLHTVPNLCAGTTNTNFWTNEELNRTTWQLILTENEGKNLYFDVEFKLVITYVEGCAKPHSLESSDITATTATVSWSAPVDAPALGYEYYVSTSPATPLSTATPSGSVIAGVTNRDLDNLTPSTQYYFWVRSKCAADNVSIWEGAGGFTTLDDACQAVNVLSENFDDLALTQIPECWNYSGIVRTTDFSAFSNSNSISIVVDNFENTPTSLLISPQFNSNTDSKSIQFQAKIENGSSSNQVSIGTMTDATNPATFNQIATVSLSSTWNYYNIVLGDIANKFVTIQYSDATDGAFGVMYADDINIILTPACVAPSVLYANSIQLAQANLGWTENGSALEWDIELGPYGFSPTGNPTQAGVTSNPYPYTSLSSATTYQFYVRANCGGTQSSWSGPFTFTTLCNDVTVTTVSPFEEVFDAVTTPQLPVCWTSTVEVVETKNLGASSYSSPNAVGLTIIGSTSSNLNPVLVSPKFNNLNTLRVKFQAKYDDIGSTSEQLTIGRMNDLNSFSTIETLNINNVWSEYTVSFSSSGSGGAYIGFQFLGEGTLGSLLIDNVIVQVIPDCPEPSDLTVTNVTYNEALLSWTEEGSANQWHIELGSQGFSPSGNPTQTANTNPFTYASLSASTDYDFYVRANCGGTQSDWVGPYTFTTSCQPDAAQWPQDASDYPFVEDFETPNCWNIPFGSNWAITTTTDQANNLTQAMYHTAPDIAQESVFISLDILLPKISEVPSLALYFMSLVESLGGYNGTTNKNSVLISTDGGSSFTEIWPLETYVEPFDFWSPITINISNYQGVEEMPVQISFKYEGNNSHSWYIDDIRIEFFPCVSPNNVLVTDITFESAVLNWTAGLDETAWNIVIGDYQFFDPEESDEAVFSYNEHNSTTLNLSGLEPLKNYWARIQSICDETTNSSWSEPYLFRTECAITPLPLIEDFGTNSNTAECWQYQGFASSPTWGVWQGANGLQDFAWLVSPKYYIEPGSRIRVQATYQYVDGIVVDGRRKLFLIKNDTDTIFVQNINPSGLWAPLDVSVSDAIDIFDGAYYRVAFAAKDPYGFYTAFGAASSNVRIEDETKQWTGAISSNWHTEGNWSPSGVPNNDAHGVRIEASAPNQPIISDGDIIVERIFLGEGATIEITNDRVLTITNQLTNFGHITVNTGNRIDVRGHIHNEGVIATNGAKLQLLTTATLGFHHQLSGTGEFNTSINIVDVATNRKTSVLKNDIVINGNLQLSSGWLSLGDYNLTVNTTSSQNANSFIITEGAGKFTRKNISTTSVVVPVGHTGNYMPVSFRTASGTYDFAVRVKEPTVPIDNILSKVWEITTEGGSPNILPVFTWTAGVAPIGFSNNVQTLLRYHNGSWSNINIAPSSQTATSATFNANVPCCSEYSPASNVNFSSLAWTGLGNGTDWNDPLNWNPNSIPTPTNDVTITAIPNQPFINLDKLNPAVCKNMTIEAGAHVTISTNKALTVHGNLTNEGTLTIESSATGDGSLIVTNTISGDGLYNIERYITGGSPGPVNYWHLMSSPIAEADLFVGTSNYLRFYEEPTNSWGAYITGQSGPLEKGLGFSFWSNNNVTKTYTGQIHNAPVSRILSRTAGGTNMTRGWNLIGNPYTSAIDFNAAQGWSKTNVGSAVYLFDGVLAGGQYRVWLTIPNNGQTNPFGISANGGVQYLAMGQGFFVHAHQDGATISMTKDVQVHNTVTFKDEQYIPNLIRVKVEGNDKSDESVLYVWEDALPTYDYRYDAGKLFGSLPQIYTQKQENNLVISALQSKQDIDGRFVYLMVGDVGEYSIQFTHTVEDENLVLKDLITNTLVETGTVYKFNASPNDSPQRFQFVFLGEITDVHEGMNNSISIWEYNNTLYIQIQKDISVNHICVYDILGNIVYSTTSASLQTDLSWLSAGLYFVSVKTEIGTEIKKITIK